MAEERGDWPKRLAVGYALFYVASIFVGGGLFAIVLGLPWTLLSALIPQEFVPPLAVVIGSGALNAYLLYAYAGWSRKRSLETGTTLRAEVSGTHKQLLFLPTIVSTPVFAAAGLGAEGGVFIAFNAIVLSVIAAAPYRYLYTALFRKESVSRSILLVALQFAVWGILLYLVRAYRGF